MIQAVIGKSVDSWCGCCKLMLAHTVEAMVNHKITRAHCNTCGAQHAYRCNPPAPRARRSEGRHPELRESRWYAGRLRSLAARQGCGQSRAYRTSERFQTDEIVDHPTFALVWSFACATATRSTWASATA